MENCDLKFETKYANLKVEMMKTVTEYTDKSVNRKYSNLPSDEREGLDSLTNKIDKGVLHVGETDKSRKFSVNTPNQYIEDMNVHVKSDRIVDRKFINKTTIQLNDTCKSLVRIVNMGQNIGHLSRILSNVHVDNFSELPSLRGLFKDHKNGRKYRPLVNGNVGPLSSLSEILSLLMKAYVQELRLQVGNRDTVKSTEELLSYFESYNKQISNDLECDNCDQRFIASMDVESLYPSLKVQPTADAIRETILKSNINVIGVNFKELGIFLRKNMSQHDIDKSAFKQFIPFKNKKVKKNKNTNVYDLWSFVDNAPSEAVIKQMFAESIHVATTMLMNNHIYEFANNKHLQEGNGSIGVEFTGVAGEIYMLIWCSKLKDTLSKLGIVNKFQHRMVDDITILPDIIKAGYRFDNGKIVYNSDKVDEDDLIPDDVRTMNVIQSVANSLDENIQVTYDVPSFNTDGRVPILDVKVKINDHGKIEYIFYKKPAANRLGTLKSSAYSIHNKMTILTQECFRRLHNTSEHCDNKVKENILSEFMIDLKLSGYDERERKIILDGGIKTYFNLKLKERNGIRPFYRSSCEQTVSGTKKNDKVKNWFRQGVNSDQFKSVMFVDATPGDKLLKMLKSTESKFMISENFRIKFVPKAGIKLKSLLQRKSIKDQTCTDNDGNPCVISDGRGIQTSKCKQNRVNYFAKCKTCDMNGKERVYHGETARNLHIRSKEHYSALSNECRNSFMYKHIQSEHKENPHEVQFEWGIVGKFVKPLYRQLNEAIDIENKSIKVNLNSKNEYFHQDVKKLGLQNHENKFQCEYCSRWLESESELQNHKKLMHIRYKCLMCDYLSFGERNLKDHQNIVHS